MFAAAQHAIVVTQLFEDIDVDIVVVVVVVVVVGGEEAAAGRFKMLPDLHTVAKHIVPELPYALKPSICCLLRSAPKPDDTEQKSVITFLGNEEKS